MKNFNTPYWNKKRNKAVKLLLKRVTRAFVSATKKQRNYLKNLGYSDYSSIALSKNRAMELISELKGGERTTRTAQAVHNAAPFTPTHPDA